MDTPIVILTTVLSLVASVVASVIVILVQRRDQEGLLRKTFGPYAGRYHHVDRAGNALHPQADGTPPE